MVEAQVRAAQGNELRRGWTILVGALLGTGLGVSSLPLYTAGVFFPHLEAEFGWSRTALSAGVFLLTLILAFASPLVGAIIDRFGYRIAISGSLLALALGFASLSVWLSSLAGYYAIIAAMAAFGAAASPVSFTKIVNSAFSQRRGLALGITLMGPGLAAAFAPAYVQWLIEGGGWRRGYLGLAALIALGSPLIIWFASQARHSAAVVISDGLLVGMSADEARRHWDFWAILFALPLLSLCLGGLVIHLVPLLIDKGLASSEAATTAGLLGVSVIIGRLLAGALVDRFFAPYVLAALVLLSAAGCLVLWALGEPSAYFAAAALGLALGAEVDVIGYLVARYYGMRAYGRIYGWQYGAFILAGGFGPLCVGFLFDQAASYDLALMLSAVGQVIVCAVLLRLPKYRF